MITLFGLLGSPSLALQEAAAAADLVVASRAHQALLEVPEANRYVLRGITAAIEEMAAQPDTAKVVVVASGDPLFYGVGRRMREAGLRFKTITAPSSIPAAFAAVSLPWDDAKVVTAHGRDISEAVATARRHAKVAVFTGPGSGAPDLARELAGVERWFVIAEQLGSEHERVRVLNREQTAALEDVSDPHVALILAEHPTEDWAPPEPTAAPVEPVIGQVLNSTAARRHADAIDKALGVTSKRYDGPASQGLPRAWGECDLIISHLATGATVRLLAGLLEDKKHDPGVVVVDEAGRFAVPLVGGHAGGANDLARQIAEALEATPVLTTATDALNLPALDTLGWAYHGDVAGVTRAIIDERPVLVERDHPWPLPPLPPTVGPQVVQPVARLVVSDRALLDAIGESELPSVVLQPPSLVVGMGCNSKTPVAALEALLERTLNEAGLALESVTALVSHEVKAGELGLIQLANRLGVPFITYPGAELARHEVPTPSQTVAEHVGTPSVSEAAVLARGAELVVPKQRTSEATCAIGRLPARGKLSVVGLGPGAPDLLTPRAVTAIKQATFVVGYGPYVSQVKNLARVGCDVSPRKMGTESARTAEAIQRARDGEQVVLVCSGDPAIYAMASPVLEQGTEGIDVEIVPGVTAELAASALLGAPLGHDHATISLSDLHTSAEHIMRRVRAAAEGDLVVALYNPQSKKRRQLLPQTLEVMREHRPATTPVAVVRQAERPQQKITMSTLGEFTPDMVDMHSIVIIGSTTTKYVTTGSGEQRIVTPRDYRWLAQENS